jgi:hypothetical protein
VPARTIRIEDRRGIVNLEVSRDRTPPAAILKL